MANFRKFRLPIRIYQLRIELTKIEPTIWRTLLVPDTIKLSKLDRVIQESFGWTNSHLHEFNVGTKRYGMVNAVQEHEWDDENPLLDERKFTLGMLLADNVHEFEYDYDFGDGWCHLIKVERHLTPNQTNYWPMCIAGENACPPEDVGGPAGYTAFIDILNDPRHDQHAELFHWVGGPFDPRSFDVNSANARIGRIR